MASIISAIYLDSYLEEAQQAVPGCIKLLLRGLINMQFDCEVVVGNLIIKDRGYSTKATSLFSLTCSENDLGTRKREENFFSIVSCEPHESRF